MSRAGTLTVAGSTSGAATNVTVNGQSATRYADFAFAKDGFTVTNGNNAFTAIAQNSLGQADTNAITFHLPASVSYTYDANGNLTGDGLWTYFYDPEDRLATVRSGSTAETRFGYDGLGRLRLRQELTMTVTPYAVTNEVRYVYDGRLVVQERHYNPQMSPTVPYRLVTYTRGLDLSGSLEGAGGIGGLLDRTDSTASGPLSTAYYHSDGNGNVTLLIDTTQNVAARYDYDPFGNTLAMSGPLAAANGYRFSSKEVNPATGLYHFGERFYHPNLQRWLNPDPIDVEGGVNLYAYVGNGPTSRLDRWGTFPMIPGGGYLLQLFYLLYLRSVENNTGSMSNTEAFMRLAGHFLFEAGALGGEAGAYYASSDRWMEFIKRQVTLRGDAVWYINKEAIPKIIDDFRKGKRNGAVGKRVNSSIVPNSALGWILNDGYLDVAISWDVAPSGDSIKLFMEYSYIDEIVAKPAFNTLLPGHGPWPAKGYRTSAKDILIAWYIAVHDVRQQLLGPLAGPVHPGQFNFYTAGWDARILIPIPKEGQPPPKIDSPW